ncbi:MAG: type II toxin-antitoxin system VapC family toxin [Solirubrobacterales bacterium]
MGPVVLDTSVVIAALNGTDVHHRDAVVEITARRLARRPLRISTVSIAELHSIRGAGRKGRLSSVERFLNSLGVDAVVGVDRPTAEIAGDARARRPSLQLADALIRATAERLGAELLTADRRLAEFDGVTLIG